MGLYEDYEETDDIERFDMEELDDSFPEEVEVETNNIEKTNHNLIRTMLRHYHDVDSNRIMARLVKHNLLTKRDVDTIEHVMFTKTILPYPRPAGWSRMFNTDYFWGNLFLVLSQPSNNLPYQVMLKEMIIKRILERKKGL